MPYLNKEGLAYLWGKLKTGLSGKQDKLTGIAGEVVGFNASGAAVAVQGWSNPNLLDNWYFADPINQREMAQYNAEGYTIDRWKMTIDIGTVSVVEDGILLDASENAITFTQPHESSMINALRGREVTASALYTVLAQPTVNDPLAIGYGPPGWTEYVSLRGANGEKRCSSGTISASNNVTDFIWIYVPLGCKIKLHALKLELGSKQTLACKDSDGSWILNDPPPDKGLELLKCQRYLQPFGSGGILFSENEGTGFLQGKLLTSMRARPAIVKGTSDVAIFWGMQQNPNLFEISVTAGPGSDISQNGVSFIVINNHDANFVPQVKYSCATDFILLSAEL